MFFDRYEIHIQAFVDLIFDECNRYPFQVLIFRTYNLNRGAQQIKNKPNANGTQYLKKKQKTRVPYLQR